MRMYGHGHSRLLARRPSECGVECNYCSARHSSITYVYCKHVRVGIQGVCALRGGRTALHGINGMRPSAFAGTCLRTSRDRDIPQGPLTTACSTGCCPRKQGLLAVLPSDVGMPKPTSPSAPSRRRQPRCAARSLPTHAPRLACSVRAAAYSFSTQLSISRTVPRSLAGKSAATARSVGWS